MLLHIYLEKLWAIINEGLPALLGVGVSWELVIVAGPGMFQWQGWSAAPKGQHSTLARLITFIFLNFTHTQIHLLCYDC